MGRRPIRVLKFTCLLLRSFRSFRCVSRIQLFNQKQLTLDVIFSLVKEYLDPKLSTTLTSVIDIQDRLLRAVSRNLLSQVAWLQRIANTVVKRLGRGLRRSRLGRAPQKNSSAIDYSIPLRCDVCQKQLLTIQFSRMYELLLQPLGRHRDRSHQISNDTSAKNQFI